MQMDKKSLNVQSDRAPLRTEHDIFRHGLGPGPGPGPRSNLSAGALNNVHQPLGSLNVEPNLLELLSHSSSHSLDRAAASNHSDFLPAVGEEVYADSPEDPSNAYRHPLDVSKQKWTRGSKSSAEGPFWMLPRHVDTANYPLPGLAVSGTNSPRTSGGRSEIEEPSPRPVWCDRNSAGQAVLMKSGDNGDSLKLPTVIKPDRLLHGSTSAVALQTSKTANGSSLVARDTSELEGKQLETSECSDHNLDELDERIQGQQNGTGKAVSKNLVSERKRRKKLNDGLYTLRALVPKISKMDKASIVGDAIDYVRELQKQVVELQAEICDIESSKPTCLGGEESLSSVVEPIRAHSSELPSSRRSWERNARSSAEVATQDVTKQTFDDLTEQKILELDVAKMEEATYHLRIFCTKGPGFFVQLMQSLEALGLEIRNANLTSFQENLLNTFIAEIKDWEMMQTDEVKRAILDVAARFGLQP